MTVRGYQLAIDWSRHGSWVNALEDVSSYVLKGDIEVSWGRDVSAEEVTLASTAGSMSFELNNYSAVFSPENTASPIVGKILPNRAVRFQVTHLGATYILLSGLLDSYNVEGDLTTRFAGTALDGWGRPGGEKLSTALYRGIRTGDAVGLVLDAIGWTGPRDLDPGATAMPWWWEEGTDAATAISKLVHSEGAPAVAYVEGGTFVFRDRHHRITRARSTTSQATCTVIAPAGTGPGGDLKIEKGSFSYNHGAKRIVNSASFTVETRTPGQMGEVWAAEDPVSIQAGETVQTIVQTNDPFHLAEVPSVAAGDIEVRSGSVTSVTLSRTSGQSAILSITCSTATVLNRVRLRAASVAVARTTQAVAADAGSIGNFGEQEWPSAAAPVWAGIYDARVIATRAVAMYATYRPTITFTVVAHTPAALAKMLSLEVSDRITVRNDRRGINGQFMIERLSHRVTNLQTHRLTITCEAPEPQQPTNIFTFDTAGKGFNDGLFGVDGIDNPATMFSFDTAGKGFNDGFFSN